MARHINWFMDGWEYNTVDHSGKIKRELVYKGAYYSLNLSSKGFRYLKAGYLLMTLAIYAVFLLFSSNGSQGGETFYSGLPCMLSIIPFIYLGMGVFCLMSAKDKMTYRSYYASIKRMTYSARLTAALLGLSVLGEVLYIVIHASDSDIHMNLELQRLFGALFCVAVTGAMLYLQKKFPVSIVGASSRI